MTKQCKQCTKVLPDTDEYFRPYTPRGAGTRQSNVGRNTVCRDCERLNNIARRLYLNGPKSEKEHELYDLLPQYYRRLVEIGGKPIGVYAKSILGDLDETTRSSTIFKDTLAQVHAMVDADDLLLVEYNRLLALELVDNPDIYQDMLDKLRERTVGPDGKVRPEYLDKFNAVATRFDNYEDNYEWED